MEYKQYTAGIGFSSYELDFFGRSEVLTEQAAFSNILPPSRPAAAHKSPSWPRLRTRISPMPQIARHLKLTRGYPEKPGSHLQSHSRRFDVGASSELDLRQAQTRVDAARVDMALFTAQVAEDENALAVLVGTRLPLSCCGASWATVQCSRTSHGSLVRSSFTPAGHPSGRAPVEGFKCQYRRGQGCLFPHNSLND